MVNSFVSNRNMDSGFSLMELALAVGVASIVATMGLVVSTAYLNDKGEAADAYELEANTRISNADILLDSVMPVQKSAE